MNFVELQKTARKLYGKAFALDAVFSRKTRNSLRNLFAILFILSLPPALMFGGVYGALSVLFGLLLTKTLLLQAFYNSYYYLEPKYTKEVFIDFDFAHALDDMKGGDVTSAFFKTLMGKHVAMRCGVSLPDMEGFLSQKTFVLEPSKFEIPLVDNRAELSGFLEALLEADKTLGDFLFSHGIQKKELIGIAEWIMESEEEKKYQSRWWAEEKLERIPGIGQDWSYGQIYTLKKYERFLSGSGTRYRVHASYGVAELEELETVLSRSRDANVLLVGDDMDGNLQIVSHLRSLITEGRAPRALNAKRVIVLDKDVLISQNGSKTQFESEFLKVLEEGRNAGNIVLVFPDLPSFLSSARTVGSDVLSLMEPYLKSGLQIIATASTEGFHSSLEKNILASERFETIQVKDIDDTNAIKVIENELVPIEQVGFFFTYPAVLAIVSGAERYFPNGSMPDKAIDLLLEIVPKLSANGKAFVEKDDVLELIETKTGIPVGEVREGEREKLMNLEEVLHARIVGQDEAVKAISNAVRRSRSGITDPKRPIGSFLFLGPTGVGKTETTKALAAAFFGKESDILRLDMSEYSSGDAVSKLIGSFEGRQSGVLSSMLTEHPYGVLLLDEFEKTTPEVMNVFLQILDEGFFSDMQGKRVNARNLIIIATSNAGSDMIWSAMKAGKDLAKMKSDVVDSLIHAGTFKPEFLNRFDGIILFHPLLLEDLKKVAQLQLNKLHDRLAERGVNLVVNEKLVDFVAGFGTDQKFGARAMNRVIQEKVEEVVAKKIIDGSVSKGQKVTLGPEDFR